MAAPVGLDGISFDEQDANLFEIDDARLRADALKHSVLPRLRMLMNVAMAQIREVYQVEALEHSIVSVFPNFRPRRERPLEHYYESAFVGLGGQHRPKWPGFSRRDGKVVHILPFRYAFELDSNGLMIVLENGWLKGLSKESSETLLRFHLDNEEWINALCFASDMTPGNGWSVGEPFVTPLREQYRIRMEQGWYDNHFFSYLRPYPVAGPPLQWLGNDFVNFYPVYHSYLRLALGLPHELNRMIDQLSSWRDRDAKQDEAEDDDGGEQAGGEVKGPGADDLRRVAQTIPVMPALRWQVFQRDGWRCVACGLGSHDEVILHVDHIIPRSRGGADTMENFQTLCQACNLGKSNRDDTDLRRKSG